MQAHRIPLDRLPADSRCLPTRPGAPTAPGHGGRILSKGEHLHHAGDMATDPHIVVSGALKGYRVDRCGNECVLRLYSEGDVIGLEALARRPALTSVVALSTAKVSPLNGRGIPAMGSGIRTASVTDHVLTGVYQELRETGQLLEMTRGATDTRLAQFLLQYGEKQALRGCKRDDFLLPFGRRDLAHYLGLATETLSRVFARLKERRILDVDNHHIVVLDLEALRRVGSNGT